MNEAVASHIFHLRRWNNVPATAHTENGLTRLTSRDVSENSNERVVRVPAGSGFIALIALAAEQIFSPVPGAYRPVIPLSTASVCALM